MGSTGKQGLTTPPRPAVREDGVPVNVTPLRDNTVAATEAFARQTVFKARNYLKAAFVNPFNLSLLAGGLVLSGLTLNPLLAVIVICLEILWVGFAPGSSLLQRKLWDPQFNQEQNAEKQQGRAARIQTLDQADRERVGSLF